MMRDYRFLVAAYNEYIKENPNSQVFLMLTEIVNSNAEVLAKHNEYVAQGYEGVIVRMFGGKTEKEREQSYYYRRRCNAILKYKEFEDAEGAIIGANPGTGTESGAIIWQIRAANGKVFDCRPREDQLHLGANYTIISYQVVAKILLAEHIVTDFKN